MNAIEIMENEPENVRSGERIVDEPNLSREKSLTVSSMAFNWINFEIGIDAKFFTLTLIIALSYLNTDL